MVSHRTDKSEVLQGTLILLVLRTLQALGPLHGYGIARRIGQSGNELLPTTTGATGLAVRPMQSGASADQQLPDDRHRRRARILPRRRSCARSDPVGSPHDQGQANRETIPLLSRRAHWLHIVGRLKAGMSVEQARVGLQPWFRSMLDDDLRGPDFPRVTDEQRKGFLASTLDVTAHRGCLACVSVGRSRSGSCWAARCCCCCSPA